MVERRAQRSLVRSRETPALPVDVQPGFDPPPALPGREEGWRNRPLPLIVLIGLLVAIFGYAALSATLPAKTVPRTFFGLSVAHTDTGLRLLWNPSAAALRGVTEAELTIVDGDHRSQLLLSPGQIRSGNLFYVPFTGEVRFHLRVQGGDRVANETVLALNQPSAQPPQPTALQGAVTFPAETWPDLISSLKAAEAAR